MSHPPPTEVLFFLWCDDRVTFDLPAGIVSPDPVTYTIDWLGEDDFAHSWAAPGKPATPPEAHSMKSTLRFIEKNAKYFNDPLKKRAITIHLSGRWLFTAVSGPEAAFVARGLGAHRLADKPGQEPHGHLQNAKIRLGNGPGGRNAGRKNRL